MRLWFQYCLGGIISIMLVCLCVYDSAHAAQNIAAAIQKKYQDVQSLRSSFTQTLTHKESGAVEKRQGTLLFEKPLRIRWETTAPMAELLLVTEDVIWNYLPDEEVAYKFPPDAAHNASALVQVITGQAALNKDFTVTNQGQEQGLTKLLLYPHEPSPQMVEAIIWVNAKTYLIEKARVLDFYGNANELSFTNITPNERFDADTFTFTPPAGVDVEDGLKQN